MLWPMTTETGKSRACRVPEFDLERNAGGVAERLSYVANRASIFGSIFERDLPRNVRANVMTGLSSWTR